MAPRPWVPRPLPGQPRARPAEQSTAGRVIGLLLPYCFRPLDVHEHRLQVPRTARYCQLGELATARQLWLVCHGYGQLAPYFIRHFRAAAAQVPGTVVVAPEGLSRFYLQGNGGRVGATWMTSEDRLTEIEDFSHYLDALLRQLLPACPPDVQVTVLGFSQGATTASRWLLRGSFTPAHLILWAGTFP